MNTAISFATNTNWQGYGGESTMSYLTQMLGLAVQNFLSAATGIAVLVARDPRLRAAQRARRRQFLGRHDAQHAVHAAAAVAACWRCVLVSQGVPQNFKPYETVPLLQATTQTETVKDADGNAVKDAAGKDVTKETPVTDTARCRSGPAASQIAIKQLGTNGGGFYNANSAHPYENPTPLQQLPRGAGDPADSRGALLHVRRHGRRPPPGLGAPGDDAA